MAKRGPKTKVSKGEHLHKRLSITIPWELWLEIQDLRQVKDKSDSGLISRLLGKAVKK